MLHYMASGGLRFLPTMHTPYDDNDFLSEGKDGVLGEPGTARTTVER